MNEPPTTSSQDAAAQRLSAGFDATVRSWPNVTRSPYADHRKGELVGYQPTLDQVRELRALVLAETTRVRGELAAAEAKASAAADENEKLREALERIVTSGETGSIGSIDNVRRSSWFDRKTWDNWLELVYRPRFVNAAALDRSTATGGEEK